VRSSHRFPEPPEEKQEQPPEENQEQLFLQKAECGRSTADTESPAVVTSMDYVHQHRGVSKSRA